MTINDLKEKRVVMLGLGVNNRELAAYLLGQGVRLTIRERTSTVRDEFISTWPEFSERVTWQTDDGLAGLKDFDLVFRSPGIPFLSPELQAFRGELSSQTKLFFDLCPCPVVGVTGTKGKGTTATLIYQMLSAGYTKGTAYLAGNIGEDPFSFLETLTAQDVVILELSSFQLQDMTKSPQVAVLLGITPDHLDKHESMEEYVEAKAQILVHQTPDDLAIINDENELSASLISRTKAQVIRYGKYLARRESAWVDTSSGQEIAYIQRGDSLDSVSLVARKLVGEHNLENILPALLVANYFRVPRQVMQKVVVSFAGLPHRLTHLGDHADVSYYDDSIATTPEAVQAALRSFANRRIHLIAGGSDKGADYTEFATDIAERCVTVTLLPGDASLKMKRAIKRALSKRSDCHCVIVDKLVDPLFETALSGIYPHVQAGDVVLLSPGAASFVSFTSYKERGDLFAKAVAKRHISA